MPEIKEYTSTVANSGLQPSETGIQATAGAARRIGAAYREAGSELGSAIQQVGTQASTYWEHREISKGAAEFSTFMAKATEDWNNVAKNADPNDPTIKEKFKEALNDRLSNFQDTFLTTGARQWSERQIDSFRNHMDEKMTADMGTLAAVAVEKNTRQLMNSSTLQAREDPTSLTEILGQNERAIDGIIASSPNLKGVQAAKAREGILQKINEETVKAAWIGKADRNPTAALKELQEMKSDDPTVKYMNSNEVSQLVRYAERQQKIDRLTDMQAKREQKQALTEQADNVISRSVLDAIDENTGKMKPGAGTAGLKALKAAGPLLENAKPGLVESAIGFFQRQVEGKEERADAPGAVQRLLARTTLAEADPLKLTDAELLKHVNSGGDDNITRASYAFIKSQMNPDGEKLSKTRTEFFKRYEAAIDAGIDRDGMKSAVGQMAIQRAETDALRMEQQLRKEGKDPSSLYDHSSPNFFGRPENLRQYVVSNQEIMAARAKAAKPSTNLTTGGNTAGAQEVINIPQGMSVREALEKYGEGKKFKTWDNRTGTLRKKRGEEE